MSLEQLFASLDTAGVTLWVEGNRLRSHGPRGAITPALAQQIRDHKEEICAILQRTVQPPALTRHSFARTAPLPLSFAQERMWLLDQLGSRNAYTFTASLPLLGDWEIGVLERAFTEILSRHESLRTTLVLVNGGVRQLVREAVNFELPLIDLRHLTRDEQEQRLKQIKAEEASYCFNLTTDVLLRTKLVQLGNSASVQQPLISRSSHAKSTKLPEAYRLLLTMHHIISDGWSFTLLVQELTTLYAAFAQGKPSPYAHLPIQYADFAVWQRAWLQEDELARQFAYWRNQLANAPTLLELPTDYSRPAQQSFKSAFEQLPLDFELTRQLQAISAHANATLFMTLLTTFQILLYRYLGQADFLIGTVIANRQHHLIEPLIGFFANTLALRADLSDNPTFLELLARTRQTTLTAYDHQAMPFEQLVNRLSLPRTLDRNPLVQVMFGMQNTPLPLIDASELQVGRLEFDQHSVGFDLEVEFEEIDGKLLGNCRYNPSLWGAATMQRLLGHFRTLLESIVANPQQSIDYLPLLTAAERQQLLVEWSSAGSTGSPTKDSCHTSVTGRCIHYLFEKQVERTPDAVAVVLENQQLTYHQLNERANQLAHQLQQLGVGAERVVGVCLERSLELIVSFWAILKAGGVYLPLDPGYPPERLAFMLEDAAPALVVGKNQQRALFAENLVLLDLDVAATAMNAQPVTNPVTNSTGASLAYLIYTSGSTGQPKGVLLEHGGLCNLAIAQIEQFAVRGESRFLQVVSPNFDVSVGEFATCFCAGATLVLLPLDLLLSSEQLTQLINHHAITHLEITPVLLATLNPDLLPTVQSVMTGGESFSADLARLWSYKQRFINVYGPTETTVAATLLNCTAYPLTTQSPPIGKPLANKQIYLLDAALQPVPIGVPGELYIGGVGVARGYLNRPELTAQRFITNPFAAGRLYRTGDLARWLPDGNIEFLGRIDQQVKIRGFRIELGEIEAVLNQHPAVQEAVVIAREDAPGEKRLVAYVVQPATDNRQPATLRSHLQQKLPEYMVPSAFVLLDALPLTPNGKIDRKALPAPELSALSFREKVVEPSTPTEMALAQIWSELLGLEQVGIHDNFFQLGGHSLLAIQVIARLRAQQKWEVPLRKLFEHSTIAELARWLDQEQGQTAESSPTQEQSQALQPVARNQLLPLSFNQEDAWFLRQSATVRSVHQQNSCAIYRLRGKLNVKALEQSINRLIQRHEILRTIFVPLASAPPPGQPVAVAQSIVAAATIVLPVCDLSQLSSVAQADEVARQQQAEQTTPLDLTQAPALRAQLLRLDSEEHRLLLTIHHITIDAWSMGILLKELCEIYRSLVLQEPPCLTPLPIQYADFAHWQRQFFTAERLSARQHYWQQLFATPPTRLQLQTDHPRPNTQAGQAYPAGEELLILTPALMRKLTLLNQQHEITLAVTLLAAYATTLYAYSGCEDVLIFAPSSNRNQIELEPLIGYFTGLALLRINLAAQPDLRELLTRTKEVMLSALTNQDLSLRHLLRATTPGWLPCGFPEREALFNFTPITATESKLPDLTITPEAPPPSTIVADIALYLMPEPTDSTGLAWQGSFHYRRDLFAPTTIRQMVQTFQQILEAMIVDPGQLIAAYHPKVV